MTVNYKTYVTEDGERYYYDQSTGLWYSNEQFVGYGYTLRQIEDFDNSRPC